MAGHVTSALPIALLALARVLDATASAVERLAGSWRAWRDARARRAADRTILDAMSDRELADVGLRRDVVDPTLAGHRTGDLYR
jgi:uncharacterized protein YjiS (DUF1127 family)